MNINVNRDGEYSGIDVIKSCIANKKEKAKCRLYIIVHQVPKSTVTKDHIRKQEDIQQVTSINFLKSILELA